MPEPSPRRRRRRAVGPPNAPTGEEPVLDLLETRERRGEDDAECWRRERPPHHDRGM